MIIHVPQNRVRVLDTKNVRENRTGNQETQPTLGNKTQFEDKLNRVGFGLSPLSAIS